MQWKVQVSTAAVVSCPAMSSVMRSSRSCLLVMSSPGTKEQEAGREGGARGQARLGQQGRQRRRRQARAMAGWAGTNKAHGTTGSAWRRCATRSCTHARRARSPRGRPRRAGRAGSQRTTPSAQTPAPAPARPAARPPDAMRKCRMEGSALERNSSTNSSSSSSTSCLHLAMLRRGQRRAERRSVAGPAGFVQQRRRRQGRLLPAPGRALLRHAALRSTACSAAHPVPLTLPTPSRPRHTQAQPRRAALTARPGCRR